MGAGNSEIYRTDPHSEISGKIAIQSLSPKSTDWKLKSRISVLQSGSQIPLRGTEVLRPSTDSTEAHPHMTEGHLLYYKFTRSNVNHI